MEKFSFIKWLTQNGFSLPQEPDAKVDGIYYSYDSIPKTGVVIYAATNEVRITLHNPMATSFETKLKDKEIDFYKGEISTGYNFFTLPFPVNEPDARFLIDSYIDSKRRL